MKNREYEEKFFLNVKKKKTDILEPKCIVTNEKFTRKVQ